MKTVVQTSQTIFELVPVELYAVQELNYLVGDFFDKALYHLVCGNETAAMVQLAAV